MENQIYIRAWYDGWHPVDAEKAKNFCKGLMYSMTCADTEKKRQIEAHHLTGRTSKFAGWKDGATGHICKSSRT